MMENLSDIIALLFVAEICKSKFLTRLLIVIGYILATNAHFLAAGGTEV